jgi:hypothetical protein
MAQPSDVPHAARLNARPFHKTRASGLVIRLCRSGEETRVRLASDGELGCLRVDNPTPLARVSQNLENKTPNLGIGGLSRKIFEFKELMHKIF